MQAERGVKNPVVFALVTHAFMFAVFLGATVFAARTVAHNTALVIIAITAPATLIIIASWGLTMAALKQRARHRLVVARNPDAVVVPVQWSSAVLAPFLKDPRALPSNYRTYGFGVEIAASAAGLGLWWSRGTRDVELFGTLRWAQIDSLTAGTAKAVIGRRLAPTIRIALRPGIDSPFTDEIELLVRKIPVDQVLAALRSQGSTSG